MLVIVYVADGACPNAVTQNEPQQQLVSSCQLLSLQRINTTRDDDHDDLSDLMHCSICSRIEKA